MNKKGFTLVELLIVLGIIAIILTIILVLLDPPRRFAEARDAHRASDVESIIHAIRIDEVDHSGYSTTALYTLYPGNNYQIGTCLSGGEFCGDVLTQQSCVDMSRLWEEGYLGQIPYDYLYGTPEKTGYYLRRNTNGTLAIGACYPERTDEIEVSR